MYYYSNLHSQFSNFQNGVRWCSMKMQAAWLLSNTACSNPRMGKCKYNNCTHAGKFHPIMLFVLSSLTSQQPRLVSAGLVKSWKTWSVEGLETLPAGTNPRTSHHWMPGGDGLRKRQRLMLCFRTTMVIINKANTNTVWKATLGKLPKNGVEHIWVFQSMYIYHLELNSTERVIPKIQMLGTWLDFK